ncbi:MAG: metallophosphoesterase, partial [Candidatus Latescibacteria bacterium]|nr:metallophosphoesterase [Candidatus Latescibacterota bacterium]
MRTLFIGDIHGCAQEFQRLLDVLNYHADSDRLFLVGDAFTKGPDPIGVWTLIQTTDARMVMGNHDAKLLELLMQHHEGVSVDFISLTKQH